MTTLQIIGAKTMTGREFSSGSVNVASEGKALNTEAILIALRSPVFLSTITSVQMNAETHTFGF